MSHKSLRVESRVIEHLGRDLITAPEVAFVELIKNAIDAEVAIEEKRINVGYYDATTYINEESLLNKFNRNIFDILPEEYAEANLFLVEDVGAGMTEGELEEGFLSIGTNIKKEKKNKEGMLLGEKGIGRLAAQRLGKAMLVETASINEDTTNLLLIEWNKITLADTINDVEVPFFQIPKLDDKYTRIWIFDVNKMDMFENPEWISFVPANSIELNSDLDNAVSFLVSPFEDSKSADIRFFYNGSEIGLGFEKRYVDYSESRNSFLLEKGKDGNLELRLDMLIKPWFVKRVHRGIIKPSSEFEKYRKSNEEYCNFVERYKERIAKTFNRTIDEDELAELLAKGEIEKINLPDDVSEKVVLQKIENELKSKLGELGKILPISGCIYSYKKDINYCKNVLEFTQEDTSEAKRIQSFLNKYNGIKLYRGRYRIGFLGNKDSDWLKFQQYKTVGHQFSRFNPGTILGQVTVNDDNQDYIKEISSRLDINRDGLSNLFLQVLEYIFNYYFYKDNETIVTLVKDWLSDEGWTQGNVKEKLETQKKVTLALQEENKRLINKINSTKHLLEGLEKNESGIRLFTENSYSTAMETLDTTSNHLILTEKYVEDSEKKLEELASSIEVDSFNNFKLMANGLVTETITHELDSLVSTVDQKDKIEEIETLSDFVWEKDRKIYKDIFIPVKDQYDNVRGRLQDVKNLYKFIEKTFIRNNSLDEYETANIHDEVLAIKERMKNKIDKESIDIVYKGDDSNWFLPKGVLLHVLYNLISNSFYWIDERRRKAKTDSTFYRAGEDRVVVESVGYDCIQVYDTGTGVVKPMEEILFQALRSGKGPLGRGMGLYIVKELLKSFGGTIELLQDRNEFGNRYIFEIRVPEECLQGVM